MATRTLVLNAEYSAYNLGGVFDTISQNVKVYGAVDGEKGQLYVQFEKLPDSFKDLPIQSASLYLYAYPPYLQSAARLYYLTSPLDIANGVYSAEPSSSYISVYINELSGYSPYIIDLSEFSAKQFIINGLEIALAIRNSHEHNIETATSTYHKPKITLTYNTGSVTAEPIGPKGFADRTQPITFSWRPTWQNFPAETITQTSATLTIRYWMAEDSQYHTLTYNISGNSTSYTIPANTIPMSAVDYWYVTVNTASGSGSSPNTNFDVLDGTPTAMAVSPNGIYVDGSAPTRFTWTHSTSTGTAQSAYDLQYIHNGSWTTLHSASTADQFYDAPAGTFDSGTQTWRVRTYNADGLASDWSNELQFVAITAPDTPQVTVTSAVPFAELSWTGTDQQAFEVQTSSFSSGLIYGIDKTYKFLQPLDDGQTTFRVRVMNIYGMWSDWGTVTATVTNTPGAAITLTAEAGDGANLSWNSISNVTEYWIYKRGALIGKTDQTTYTDRTASGSAVYRVRAIMSDGMNYTDSNTVSVTVTVDHPSVFALDGSAAVDLTYSISSAPTVTTSFARDISFMQYNNTELPTTEASPFRSHSVTIAPAFKSASEAAAFESLIGKLVCYRDQYGTNITGVMSAMSKTHTVFFVSYATTITEVDPADYEIY